MHYLRRTFLAVACILIYLAATSCKKDIICPAYQSYFLLDSGKREKYFSLFGEDSLPKEIVEVKKSKFGIMEKMTYRKKDNSFHTLPMDVVYPELSDSAIHKTDSIPLVSGDSLTLVN